MDIPSVVKELVEPFNQPGAYEAMLVGAGVSLVGLVLVAQRYGSPWWEARSMRMDQEKRNNTTIAAHTIGMLRYMVKDGTLSVEAAKLHIERVANLVPLKEIIRDEGYKTLKEALLEKHDQLIVKQEVKEPTIITEVQKKTGMLASMTARLNNA